MGLGSRITNAYKALRGIPFETSAIGGDFPFGINFSLWNRLWSSSGNAIDFERELGDLSNSSIVMAGYEWVGRNLSSARPQVITLDGDQKEVEIAEHPLPKILKRPNPYSSFGSLCYGIAYSWITYATAYLLKVRDGAGQVAELWWEPHYTIRPMWPEDGSEFISHFEVNRNGYWLRVEKEDVIVFRKGLDANTRCGVSATAALLRDYYTEMRAANLTAMLVTQGLVPPLVVGLGDKETPFKGDLAVFKAEMIRRMKENAGEPMVTEGPVSVAKLGFDYSSVGMRDLRQVPQMAFCSAMGISPTSLYFDTSRKESTFANVEQFLKHDYRSYIVPLHDHIADILSWELLPEFDSDDSHRVTWDYSQVAIMQPDQNEMAKSAVTLFEKDVLKRSEAREMIGYKWDEEDEVYYSEIKPQKTSATMQVDGAGDVMEGESKPNGHTTMTDEEMKAAKIPGDAEIDSYSAHWSEVAPEAARGLFEANTKPS